MNYKYLWRDKVEILAWGMFDDDYYSLTEDQQNIVVKVAEDAIIDYYATQADRLKDELQQK